MTLDGIGILGAQSDEEEKADEGGGLFTALVLLLLAFPVGAALVMLPRYLKERRRIARWDVSYVPQPERRLKSIKVTKQSLRDRHSDEAVGSALRVLEARRLDAERDRLTRNVETLQLAEIRRWAKSIVDRAARSARAKRAASERRRVGA